MAGKQWENHCHSVTSCALAGAAAFFAGIPDAFIVANGPAWCYFYALRKIEQPGDQLAHRFYSTYPDNKSVIFGTENKLLNILDMINSLPKQPAVLLIENSCAISLIGDDIRGIAAGTQPAYPVVTFDSGGLTGGHWEGYRKAAMAYFRELPPESDVHSLPKTVNLIGADSSYYRESDDLTELRRLLEKMGIDVHAVVGYGSSVEDLRKLKKAELNIVIHQETGSEIAEYLESEAGIPCLDILPPYGIKGTREWLTQVAEALAIPPADWQDLQDELNETEERLYLLTRDAQKVWGIPWFEHLLLAGPSSVVKGMAGVAREEWLDTADVLGFTHDDAPAEGNFYPLNGNADLFSRTLTHEEGLVLGSGYERKLAQELHTDAWEFITIANLDPAAVALTPQPAMGIQGAYVMAERIWHSYIRAAMKGER